MKLVNKLILWFRLTFTNLHRRVEINMFRNPFTELQNLLFGLYIGLGLFAFIDGFSIQQELLLWLPFCAFLTKDFLKRVIFILAAYASFTFYVDVKSSLESAIYLYYIRQLPILINFSGILTAGTIAIIAILIPLGGRIIQKASESLNDDKVLKEFVHPISDSLKNEILIMVFALFTAWLFPGHVVFLLFTSIVVFIRVLLLAQKYFDYVGSLEDKIVEGIKVDLKTKIRMYIHDKLKSTI